MEDEVYEFKVLVTYEKFYSEDSTWGTYIASTEDDIPFFSQAERNQYDVQMSSNIKFCNIVGKMQQLSVGCEYKIKAKYEYNKQYGHQYHPIAIYALIPQTKETQLLFLKTLIPEWIAENLIAAYPNVVNDVANGTLREIDYSLVKGVREIMWGKIKDKIINNYLISDIIIMLKPLGVTYAMIKKLLTDEPNPVLLKQELEKNPYILTRINGLGFKKVDDLALKMNPELIDSSQRLVAYTKYYFTEIGDSDGHTWVSLDILKASISNNVPECIGLVEWMLENNEFLYQKDSRIGLKVYHDIEMTIFNILMDKALIETEIHLTDEQITKAINEAEDEQGFQYVKEQREAIINTLHQTVSFITGKAGCVDCDTEYFNGYEWKKISDYKDGDLVLQYNEDKSANLVKPTKYYKQQCDTLYHFETKYGLDQVVSAEHRVAYVTEKLADTIKFTDIKTIKEKQESDGYGFRGKFITSFNYCGNTPISYSDDMLRLLVAVIADGTFNYKLAHGDKLYCRTIVNVKKGRKKDRLEYLLEKNHIQYYFDLHGDFIKYIFFVPDRIKHFPIEWYGCTKHQQEIIADEVMYWDARISERNEYYTTDKQDADFIQFIFTSLGYRASILPDDRYGEKYKTGGKTYIRKSICYRVNVTKRNLVSLCNDIRKNHIKTKIEEYEPKDGYEYCFSVPSGMLILRRNNKIFVTGNCGKTSIMRAVIKAYKQNGYSISACALSAMAAARITEATNFPAMTIHRTLGCKGVNDFTYNKDNPLITSVAFMDEGSMVNASLFLNWLEAINDNTRIIISGDHKQLPPIGFGNVFSDLCEMFKEANVSKLVKPMRQAEKSGILVDANLIRDNINPITENIQPRLIHGELQDMYYIFRENRQSLFNIAVKTFLKSIETDGIDNVVIAVPRRKDCLNSTCELNKVIQNELLKSEKSEISGFDITFKLGARVMQTVNDYDKNVFNGEIGYITKIDEQYEGKKKQQYCEVTYRGCGIEKEKVITYLKKELSALDLAYAMTVHKLQGAGRKTVIGIIDNTHYKLLDNCMLYTLLTRAKQRCCLLAEPQAFYQCIRTSHNKRNTWIQIEDKEKG